MYAIIEVGGRQWKVEPGSRMDVNRLSTAVGAAHAVDRVLLAQDGSRLEIGRPYLKDAKVVCEVLEHRLGPKEITYKYRRRENWRKTVGHRQPLTRLVVKDIVLNGSPAASSAAVEAAPKTETMKTRSPKLPTARAKTAKTTKAGKE